MISIYKDCSMHQCCINYICYFMCLFHNVCETFRRCFRTSAFSIIMFVNLIDIVLVLFSLIQFMFHTLLTWYTHTMSSSTKLGNRVLIKSSLLFSWIRTRCPPGVNTVVHSNVDIRRPAHTIWHPLGYSHLRVWSHSDCESYRRCSRCAFPDIFNYTVRVHVFLTWYRYNIIIVDVRLKYQKKLIS